MGKILKVTLVLGGGFLILITISILVTRRDTSDWTFVAWADHGQHQGLVRLSLENGVQDYYRASTIYNPEFVPSPDGMWLVYDRFIRGKSDIYRVRIHDGHTQNLTRSDTSDTLDSWSPDGKWLLFWSHDDDHHQLKRLDWQTLKVEPMGEGFRYGVTTSDISRWSPDSSMIYYLSSFSLESRLHIVHMDGQETVYPLPIGDPLRVDMEGWSPDSQWLIFQTVTQHLYRLDIVEGTIETYPHAEHFGDLVSWSPDATWLYYSSTDGPHPNNLYRMRPDGRQQEYLSEFDRIGATVMWSSDGSWLYYIGGREVLSRTQANDSNTEEIAGGFVLIQDIFWSLDHEWLYIVSAQEIGQDMDLYRVRPDGTDQQLIIRNFRVSPVLSPDGNWLLYASQQRLNEELFRTKLDGSEAEQLTFSEGQNVDFAFQAWLYVPEMAWEPLFLGILGVVGVGLGIIFSGIDKVN